MGRGGLVSEFMWGIVGKEDGGGDLINDGCDKYDDDCDDYVDNTSCNVSIIKFENLMFPFSMRWRWPL